MYIVIHIELILKKSVMVMDIVVLFGKTVILKKSISSASEFLWIAWPI